MWLKRNITTINTAPSTFGDYTDYKLILYLYLVLKNKNYYQ